MELFSYNCLFDSSKDDLMTFELKDANILPRKWYDHFISRYSPGDVRKHSWDGHLTNTMLLDEVRGVFGSFTKHVEVVRRHPGDRPVDDREYIGEHTTLMHVDAAKYAPTTTKAGSRLFSITFGQSDGTLTSLRSSYPMQILIRFDEARQYLSYEAFEHEKSDDEPLSEKYLKGHIGRMLSSAPNAVMEVLGLLGLHSVGDNNDSDLDLILKDKESMKNFENSIRFKNSHIYRARFDVSSICAARLIVLDCKARPNASSNPYVEGKLKVSDLGTCDDEEGKLEVDSIEMCGSTKKRKEMD